MEALEQGKTTLAVLIFNAYAVVFYKKHNLNKELVENIEKIGSKNLKLLFYNENLVLNSKVTLKHFLKQKSHKKIIQIKII